jgi:hypothetical protein
VSCGDGTGLSWTTSYRGQLIASESFTEPSTGQPLTKEQMSQLGDNLALREAINHFFKHSASGLKVGTDHSDPGGSPGGQAADGLEGREGRAMHRD